MSLLNNPDGIAHGSINGGGGVIVAGGGTIQFEMQAALIPDQSKFEYESARSLARMVRKTFDSGSADQYFLYFHGVDAQEYDVIEQALCRVRIRNAVRLTFENTLDAAIVRITPGPEHRAVVINLYYAIFHKIISIPGHSSSSVEPYCSTLFQVPGVRGKQGDEGIAPTTRVGRSVWPSMMIEIGYAGGEDFLRLDAQWWLINSAGRTRLVILVFITKNPLALGIECWSMTESSGLESRQTSLSVPTCVDNFNIDSFGNVKSLLGSTELRIPYTSIFDELNGDAADVVFSFDELSRFALRRYQMMI